MLNVPYYLLREIIPGYVRALPAVPRRTFTKDATALATKVVRESLLHQNVGI